MAIRFGFYLTQATHIIIIIEFSAQEVNVIDCYTVAYLKLQCSLQIHFLDSTYYELPIIFKYLLGRNAAAGMIVLSRQDDLPP